MDRVESEVESACGIEREEDLRGLYPPVSPLAQKKCIPALDRHCIRFISLSPFLCIGTAGADGKADVSPRGDPPGFVRVLDETPSPYRTGPATTGSIRSRTSCRTRMSASSS